MPSDRQIVRRSAVVLLAGALGGLAGPLAASAQPAPTAAASAAACFTGAQPAQIATGCDAVLAAATGTYTADQIGLALQRRGAARTSVGRNDEAIGDFRRMAAANFKPHEAHASIGSIEHGQGKLAEAEASYRRALEVNPSYALALSGLGQTLIALDRPGEAIGYFDRALATVANDADTHYGKGLALAATGKPDLAVRSLDEAIRLRPRFVQALYQRAQVRHDKGAFAEALEDADVVVSATAGEEKVRALTYRGRVRNNAKRYAGAIADCAEAAALAERLALKDARIGAAASVCLGLARQNVGELGGARADFDKALTVERGDATAFAGRGHVLLQMGRFEEAAADFGAALRIEPRSQDALRFLGVTLAEQGDFARAREIYARAIGNDARDYWPYLLRALAMARHGDRAAALADIAEAVKLAGDKSSDTILTRGAVHYFLDDLDAARTDMDAAIRLDAGNGQAHRLLGRLHLRQGRLDEAGRAFDTAARLLQSELTLVANRGLLALARRDYGGALQLLTQSIGVNAAHAEPLVARGEAYEGQGRRDLAIADYRAAEGKLATDPDGRRAKMRARERLAALGVAPAPAVAGGTSQAPTATGPAEAGAEPSAYCRVVESVLYHSRRYSGVAVDVGCGPGTTRHGDARATR